VRYGVFDQKYLSPLVFFFDSLVEDIEDRDCVTDTFRRMYRGNMLSPIIIDKTKESCSIYSNYFKSFGMYMRIIEPCFVFGNEGGGIPEYLIEDLPQFHIPQRGVIRSLNVSSAAAMVMHEFTREFNNEC